MIEMGQKRRAALVCIKSPADAIPCAECFQRIVPRTAGRAPQGGGSGMPDGHALSVGQGMSANAPSPF
jgi:hypothetical protein